MRRRLLLLLAVAAAVLAVAPIAPAANGTLTLYAALTGAAEVPGPGDPDGTGFARITLNVAHGTICWELSWTNLDPTIAAHIHVGPAGVAGPVVVPLSVNGEGSGTSSGCTEVDRHLINAILRHPDQYYVNIHTTVYPAGAIRGQLSYHP
jgi:hypothetical protein